ncbi:MAG: hypothetical protein AAF821_04805 [Cyanobacteria bacterium P01_D01_bin.156]
MTAIALRTELDVAELLLAKGWLPEEINSILEFPLPKAAFHHLPTARATHQQPAVTKVTATPVQYARQILQAAGWLEQELDSLLKPCLPTINPWLNQTVQAQSPTAWLKLASPAVSLQQYRRTMAIKRLSSFSCVITGICLAVALAS